MLGVAGVMLIGCKIRIAYKVLLGLGVILAGGLGGAIGWFSTPVTPCAFIGTPRSISG